MLLLVVLSLLMLFSLVAVTFVLVAGRHYDSTRYAIRNEQTGDNPRQLLDEVFAQCIRGTNNPYSVIGPYSLLEDMYGNDGIRGTVTSAVQNTSGLIDLTINGTPTATTQYAVSGGGSQPIVTALQIQNPGQFNGCVLTMLDGPAAGKSTRIVGWTGGTSLVARLMPFEGTTVPAAGNSFIINGRPFNGTGAGFNPSESPTANTLLNAEQEWQGVGQPVKIPYVLMPNPVFFGGQSEAGIGGIVPTTPFPDYNYPNVGGIGGMDEDYDAPDVQNMLLAHIPVNPAAGYTNLIPSLHRPDTIQFVKQQFAGSGADSIIERQLLLRPRPQDHPAFAPWRGDPTNFGVTSTNQAYDVDNDGDGITDSIWVDAGLPVRTSADGRMYKPMVAVLCIDLDGRLNVNAHGSIAQVDRYLLDAGDPAPAAASVIAGQFNSTPSPFRRVSRGQGFGPAEISLFPLFNPLGTVNPPVTVNDFYARLLAARYGESNTNFYDFATDSANGIKAVYSSAPTFTPGASEKLGAFPGKSLFADRLADLKFAQYPYYGTGAVLSAFKSPPDLHGRGYVVLDGRGMPVYLYESQFKDRIDSPYEINLTKPRATNSPATTPTAIAAASAEFTPNPVDSPFSTAELERILRMYDLDSQDLPDRLRAVLDGTGGPPLALLRGMITTDSHDTPTPTTLPTRDIRAQAGGTPLIATSLCDLFKARAQGVYTGLNLNLDMLRMLPPDVVSGLRFDLNRPFGNGRDDSASGTAGYGIVDEPGENETAAWNVNSMTVPPRHTSSSLWPNLSNGQDMDGDGDVDSVDNRYARQLYARYLYVLMMLLKDRNAQFDADGDGSTDDTETAYAIAQWAVNVVDFRDADSIMTRFVFNIYPFRDGWTAPVDPTTSLTLELGEVWGCERPELLMTETLAFHDRRTEDLAVDDTVNMPMNPADPDTDFDQRLLPRGSLFIEVYNPWTTQTSSVGATNGEPTVSEAPGEFYNVDATAGTVSGVNLRAAPGGSPAWRMLIVMAAPADQETINGVQLPKDPEHFDTIKRLNPGSIERSIYFTTPPPGNNDGKQYFANTAQAIPPLQPGRYAVIGSAGVYDGVANYITPIGRQNQGLPSGTADTAQDGATHAAMNTTRRIVLTPSADLSTPNSVVQSNRPTDPPPTAYLRPISVVIDQAIDGGATVSRSVSISEPTGGYIAALAPATPPNEPVLASTQDVPLDIGNAAAPVNASVFRYVHLQRLADPTRPHDSVTNPYRTIDSAPIAMSVFNGVASSAEPGIVETGLASWQRGGTDGGGGGNASMIWKFFPNMGSTTSAAAGPPIHNFPFVLDHTLGFLNVGYGNVQDTTTYSASPPYASYLGSPLQKPFPWLTWNNRPYANAMELLLVPRSRSSRLMFEYQAPSNQPYNLTLPVGHLLPFFGAPVFGSPLEFHRVFDYVGVRSPFVGTETELDPVLLTSTNPSTFNTTEQSMMSYFHTPFNRVSNYRETGKININTIVQDADPTSSSIWNGVLNHDVNDINSNTGMLWPNVAASRRGYTTGNGPSQFTNPVRSATGESLMLPKDPSATTRDEIDVTLLRPADPTTSSTAAPPLLGYQSTQAYNNTNLHHYFSSQVLRRLGNSVTTRSNVYAIWLTVGYFEVRPAATTVQRDSPWPDGYQLWGELGSETGEVKRHRAFYIYDRSIPVGFERGKDHNFADGILLKRFIE